MTIMVLLLLLMCYNSSGYKLSLWFLDKSLLNPYTLHLSPQASLTRLNINLPFILQDPLEHYCTNYNFTST